MAATAREKIFLLMTVARKNILMKMSEFEIISA